MIGFLLGAIKIIALLGFLIFIHEFGHFTIAKLCKVKVNEFSLGFGPILLKKQGKETKYAIRLIPLGGFVSMEGEVGDSDSERAFNKVSIPKRIAIVAAGGLVNIIFAVSVFLPVQMASGPKWSTTIDTVNPGAAAETYGLQSGDVVKKINGKTILIKSDVDKIMKESDGSEITILIERDGQKIEKKLVPTPEHYYTTGIYFDNDDSTKVQAFAKDDQSIEKYGVNIGDTIIQVAGVDVENNSKKLTEVLNEHYKDESINMVVKRLGSGNVSIDFTLVKNVRYKLGVDFAKADDSFGTRLFHGLVETRDFVFSMVDNLRDLFTGQVKSRDFMGVVGISKTVAKTDTFKSFITLMTLISLSLGVMNLLPFPPLDGGKIVLLIVEAIRRKPLDEKYEIGIQFVGFALMIILAIYVTYHDLIRII